MFGISGLDELPPIELFDAVGGQDFGAADGASGAENGAAGVDAASSVESNGAADTSESDGGDGVNADNAPESSGASGSDNTDGSDGDRD